MELLEQGGGGVEDLLLLVVGTQAQQIWEGKQGASSHRVSMGGSEIQANYGTFGRGEVSLGNAMQVTFCFVLLLFLLVRQYILNETKPVDRVPQEKAIQFFVVFLDLILAFVVCP